MTSYRSVRITPLGSQGPERLLYFTQPRDPGDLRCRHDEMFVLGRHAKLCAPLDVFIFRQLSGCGEIVNAGIEDVNTTASFRIEPPDIGALVPSFDHDGNPVQR